MKVLSIRHILVFGAVLAAGFASATAPTIDRHTEDASIGRFKISTIPLAPDVRLRSATYTPGYDETTIFPRMSDSG